MPRINFRAMGSEILAVLDQDIDTAKTTLDSIPLRFEEWEQILSRFRAHSELSRLNRSIDQPVEVSDMFWDVYESAQWAETYTHGLVTPTIYDALIESGYDRNFDDLPRYQRFQDFTLTAVDPLSMVIVDKKLKTICLPPNVHLDFGGIAKGWAAHQAMQVLKEHGPALVNAGGDIAISGPRNGGLEWEIEVRNPFESVNNFEVLYVKRGGVATSGKDKRRWLQGNQLRHHIIDPQTGLPAETDIISATVIAPSVMEAEAAAKAAVIMGSAKALDWVESNSQLACLLVLENGNALYSAAMQNYL